MSRELLKQALDALENPALPVYTTLRKDIRIALAQPAPEPVAWRIFDGEGGYDYRDEAPELFNIDWAARYGRKYEPLYAQPAPAVQPLTNGEIYTAYITATNQTLRPGDERLAFAFARAIEAAHGIGGGGNG